MSSDDTYPGGVLAVPDRTGEAWGRVGTAPTMLDEEEEEVEEEEEEASMAGLLLADRENGPGKLSSGWRGKESTKQLFYLIYINALIYFK